MSKRRQESQGGEERYGFDSQVASGMADKPQQATAAQLARRKIAAARKPSGSQRSSRANTPTANPFGNQQQQSMPSFQAPAQGGTGFGGNFNFTAAGGSNPFAQQNGTPPPATFSFGGQSTTQQNGGSGLFGGGSTTFGAQPQQNGFNPSTTSIFGNSNANNNENNNTSSFTFGQGDQSQSQQNGVTPSTNASFPTFGSQNNDNPFKNFGQSQQTQSTPSTSFGGFGQNSQQQNGEKTPATPSFGGFGQTNSTQPQENGGKSLFSSIETPKPTTSSIFSGFGQQQNKEKTPFGTTSQAEQTPEVNSNSIFSGLQQSKTPQPLFGATPPPEQGAPNGESVIKGLDAARAGTIKPGMFTSGQSDTSKPPKNNLFSLGETNTNAQETPKANSLFSNFGQSQQTNAGQTSIFGGNTANQQQTPKANGSLFNFGQSQQQSSSTTGFNLGQNQAQSEDASMTTPGSTPQKPSLFGNSLSQPTATSSGAAPAASGTNETPANQGGGLFDRISKDAPATAQKSLFNPSTSLFNGPTTSTTNEQTQTPAATGGSLFDRVSRDDAPATAHKQTSFTPSTSLFNKPAETAAATPSAAPWISHAPAAPTAPQTTVTPPTPRGPSTAKKMSSSATSDGTARSAAEQLKQLNEGLMRHLGTQDRNSDWTTVMQYYVQQAAEIHKKQQPGFGLSSPTKQAAPSSTVPTSNNLFSHENSTQAVSTATSSSLNNLFGSNTPKAPATNTSNMFSAASSQETPKPRPGFRSQPPATEPVNKKRPAPFEEDDGDDSDRAAPATEKRARADEPINYPKLPDNASQTAKLFQAALDKSGTDAGSSASSSSGLDHPPSSSGGFKPAGLSSGMPTFSAPASDAGSFLSAFGKKANAEEEKQKKKRKAEDYDSDEETEEQWEKRDREEQEAKRKKIEAAAKSGSGFSLPGSSNVSTNATPDPEARPETPLGVGKSLFERISKDPPATAPSKASLFPGVTSAGEKPTSNLFGSKTPAATSSSNLFSNLGKGNKDDANKEHESSDHTWNKSTPIKFGGSATTGTESTTPAAPPPKFGNLFGAKSQTSAPGSSSGGLLNIPGAKPSLGFNFGGQPGSLATSRATTPGITTDGEGASTAGEGEGDDEASQQKDPQLEDQTGLLDEEKAKEDVLYSVSIAKAQKYEEKKDADSGGVKKDWVEKGKGPLYILKNKETGKVRVLLKIPPLGKAAMNFAVLKDPNLQFTMEGAKRVRGSFIDHMAYGGSGGPSPWLLSVGKKEDAEEMFRVLREAAEAA